MHVKINTGMNRLGLTPGDAPAFLAALRGLANLEVEGIYTHFATSDTDRIYAAEQFARFLSLLAQLAAAGLRPPIAHAAKFRGDADHAGDLPGHGALRDCALWVGPR